MVKIALKWIGYGLLVLCLFAGANQVAGYIPFTPQWSARRSAEQVKVLKADISTLQLEASGNAEIGQATETFHTREIVIRDLTSRAETEARNAPNANIPLADERADRLRAVDDRLCDSLPALCAPVDPAGGGATAVPPAGPAG